MERWLLADPDLKPIRNRLEFQEIVAKAREGVKMVSLNQMHTTEHILTRVMKDHFGATRNFEMHLGEKKVIPVSEAEGYDLWKVPEEAAEIRIVRIGDLDATPCAGEHVANTPQLGQVKIISYSRKENGFLRIHFKLLTRRQSE